MARLTSEFGFTGSLGDLSAYKMRGVDRIILRTKGGASRDRIKTSPAFDLVRRNNVEFSGRAAASKWIMRMLWPLKPLADYNIAGPLNALVKPIQALDKGIEKGRRGVPLSKNPKLMEGFSLNRKTPIESVVRTPFLYSISRESLSASVDIPALLPGINFVSPNKSPMYRFIAVLGIVPDITYDDDFGKYRPSSPVYDESDSKTMWTEWFPVFKGSTASRLELTVDANPPDQAFSLMLSVGICFGTMEDAETVKQVKYEGCAKVLGMA